MTADATPARITKEAGHTGNILLVDDDKFLLDMYSRGNFAERQMKDHELEIVKQLKTAKMMLIKKAEAKKITPRFVGGKSKTWVAIFKIRPDARAKAKLVKTPAAVTSR